MQQKNPYKPKRFYNASAAGKPWSGKVIFQELPHDHKTRKNFNIFYFKLLNINCIKLL